MIRIALLFLTITLAFSCSNSKLEKKGFPVSESGEAENTVPVNGENGDTLTFRTKPRNILLTGNAAHRLTPIFRVNYDKRTKKPYTGSNNFLYNYEEHGEGEGNQWNHNFMPGIEAVNGYNFVNISHYNNESKTEHQFFEN